MELNIREKNTKILGVKYKMLFVYRLKVIQNTTDSLIYLSFSNSYI